MTGGIHGPWADVLQLLKSSVESRDRPSVAACIDHVVVARIGSDVSALTSACVVPVLAPNVAIIGAAGNCYGAIVLLRSVDVIEGTCVGRNVIELRRWLVVLCRPTLARIHRNSRATVISVDHAVRVGRVNPESVVIAVR